MSIRQAGGVRRILYNSAEFAKNGFMHFIPIYYLIVGFIG